MVESRIRSAATTPDNPQRKASWITRHPFASLLIAFGTVGAGGLGIGVYQQLIASPETKVYWAQLDQQKKEQKQHADLLRQRAAQVNKLPALVLPDGDITTHMYTDRLQAGEGWGVNDRLGEVTVTRESKTYTSVNRQPRIDIPWLATTHIDKNPNMIFVSAVSLSSAQEAEGYIAQHCGSITGNQMKVEGGIVSESISVESSDCILPQTT